MVTIRRTAKLKVALPDSSVQSPVSDTALGDWYVNRLVVERRPLLLIVSEKSLLPIIIPARDVRSLPARLPELVRERLARIEIRTSIVDAEIAAMEPVLGGGTLNRSALGVLVNFGQGIPYYVEFTGVEDEGLRLLEERLEETPCHASGVSTGVIFPLDKTPELLDSRWGTAG